MRAAKGEYAIELQTPSLDDIFTNAPTFPPLPSDATTTATATTETAPQETTTATVEESTPADDCDKESADALLPCIGPMQRLNVRVEKWHDIFVHAHNCSLTH